MPISFAGWSITGELISPPNLGWGSIPLKKYFEDRFSLPIYLSNDANVAALGEKVWGAAKEMNDFIVVTLGTGIGTGVFVNNGLLHGHNGLGGEGGHIQIYPEGRICGCGGHGHLECYASVRGIKETVRMLTNKEYKFKEIAEGYRAGETVMVEAFRKTAKYLAIGLADMGSLFLPKAFILAGGIATIGESFREQVEMYYNQQVFLPFKNQTEILTSQIATEHGAVLGAASQVFYHE